MPMKRQSKRSRYNSNYYCRQLCYSFNQGIFKVHPKEPGDLETKIEDELKARKLAPNGPKTEGYDVKPIDYKHT